MRVMGIETEYGILGEGTRQNPIALSGLVVVAYDQARGGSGGHASVRWSYDGEDPLADARGWRVERSAAHPSQLTDDPSRPAGAGPSAEAGSPNAAGPDPTSPDSTAMGAPLALLHRRRGGSDLMREESTVSNLLLTNGGRLYVDHAHPEYSSPEVASARDAVLWDRAGEEIMLAAVRTLAANPHTPQIALYKNNVDGKGASYGTHENYLVTRTVPFEDIVRYLTPYLVTRQILVGAGRVGIGPAGEQPGFQISQRADYIEAEVGLETTLRRPIINTRDEPHADPATYRRLHLIIGDANCSEVATFLKLGATSLVLAVLEQVARGGAIPAAWDGLDLLEPVDAVRRVSQDLTLTAQLPLADGTTASAWEIQQRYLAGVRQALTADDGDAHRGQPDTDEVVATWERLLTLLRTDQTAAAREIEWLAKLHVLQGLRERHHLAWDHAKVQAVDLQWSDVRPERGLYARLRAAGAVTTMVSQTEVSHAVAHPPRNTRAWFRGELVRRYPGAVESAGWASAVVDAPDQPSLVRIPMPDPTRGTAALLEEVMAAHPDISGLVRALGG